MSEAKINLPSGEQVSVNDGVISPETLMADSDEVLLKQLRLLAEHSLYFFSKTILGNQLLYPRIHLPICQRLEDMTKRRHRILLPRSWYKTTLMISYVLWRALKNPELRILYCMNTVTNAISKLSTIDKHIKQTTLVKLLWPERLPNRDCIWTAEKMCLRRTGAWAEATFEAAGIRTGVVSRHYDIIVEDDTVAPDLDEIGEDNMTPTKEDIGKAIGWHRLATPLLNSPKESQIVVIGTRWFEKDLLSWIWDNEKDQYSHYERASLETNGVADENGEPTFPEQFDREVLMSFKATLGPYMFSCLYLNKPIRSSDMLFDPMWFQFYEDLPRHNHLLFFTCADPAGAPEDTKGEPDWCATITAALDLTDGTVYIVDTSRGKWNPGQHLDNIFWHIRTYQSVKLGFESVALAKAYLHWIRIRMEEEKLFCVVEGVTHAGKSKGTRIMGLQPPVHSGRIKFKRHHRELQTEMTAFPYGANDDLVDTLAMLMAVMPAVVKQDKKAETAEDEIPDQYDLTFDAAYAALRAQHGREQLGFGPVSDILQNNRISTDDVTDQIRTRWTRKAVQHA